MKLSKKLCDDLRRVMSVGGKPVPDVLRYIGEQRKFIAALSERLGTGAPSAMAGTFARLADVLEGLRVALEVVESEKAVPAAAPGESRKMAAEGGGATSAAKSIDGPRTTPAWKAGPASAKVFIDGCSKGNPGAAAGGIVFTTPTGDPLHEEGVYFGTMTNNQAEYRAALRALEIAAERGLASLFVFSDSELVVKQLNGLYKIKNADLAELAADIQRTRKAFKQCTFTAVPREKNKRADELANWAIRERGKGGASE